MATWKGQFVITESCKRTIVFDRWGVAGGTLNYWGPFSLAVGCVMGRGYHEKYDHMKIKSATISRSEADFAEISIQYEGVPPETDQKLYHSSGATSSEDIASHPRFSKNAEGGEGFGTTENGAIFKNNKFIGWKSDSKYAGITSYLSAGFSYEEIHTTGNVASAYSFQRLGRKDNPPSSPCLPSLSGREWMLASGNVEVIGDRGGKITKSWRMSGRGGLDSGIYPNSDADEP